MRINQLLALLRPRHDLVVAKVVLPSEDLDELYLDVRGLDITPGRLDDPWMHEHPESREFGPPRVTVHGVPIYVDDSMPRHWLYLEWREVG